MTEPLRTAAVLGIVSLLLACGGAAADGPAVALRDSAGITIVENGAGEPRELSLTGPVLQIGEIEGREEYQLHDVRHVARLSNGSIAVATGQTIRYYDSAGVHLRSTGREGSGPGEFRRIGVMVPMHGDSLLVFDGTNRRVSVLAPDGSFARDFTPAAGTTDAGSGQPASVRAALADGTLLLRTPGEFPGASKEHHRDTVGFTIVRADTTVETLAYPAAEMNIVLEQSGGEISSIMLMGVPFGRNVHVGAATDRFLIGSSDSYEIHVWNGEGTLDRIVRSAHVPAQPVTDALLREYAAAQLAWRRRIAEENGQAFDEAEARAQEPTSHAPQVPAFSDIIAARSGGMWVRSFTLPDGDRAPVPWSVFDAEGRLTGAVELPARFRPMVVDGDMVFGVILDELDVQYVHAYRLVDRP